MTFNQIFKTKIILIFTLLFIIISLFFYQQVKSYATIEFEQKNLNVPGYARFCEIFFAANGSYIHNEEYILPKKYNQFNKIKIDIKEKDINQIRLDPLRDKGEIYIRNFFIIQYDGFKKIKQKTDFTSIDSNLLHNINILKKDKNGIHLQAIGEDPYLILTTTLNINTHLHNYFFIMYTFLYTAIIIFIFILIYYGLEKKYYTLRNVIILLSLLIYTFSVVLFGKHVDLAYKILLFTPFLNFILIKQNGIQIYYPYIKNVVIFILGLTSITLVSDYAMDTKYIHRYFEYFPSILASLFIPMLFIDGKSFNRNFYKFTLFILTILFAIFTILLHYHIINITDNIITGYRMTESIWAQKNYSFWYLFLMWGTISFFNIKPFKNKDFIFIVILLFFSYISIMSGYSESAKLALLISSISYIIFSYLKINLKFLLTIPILLSLYFLVTPFIAELFVLLSDIHPRLAGREAIFAVYSSLIYENWLFGYGFNSCISLVPSDYLSQDIIQIYKHTRFTKICSPHTLPLVLWLNFGLLGAIFTSILLYISTKKLIIKTYNQPNFAALVSMITAFLIITAFSWGSWYAHTLLTYSFFIGILLLSLNINNKRSK